MKIEKAKYMGFLEWPYIVTLGFSYSKNTANFEAYSQVISSSINFLFLKSGKYCKQVNARYISYLLLLKPYWEIHTNKMFDIFCEEAARSSHW